MKFKMTKRQRRDLIVRAIEDFIVLYIMIAGLWTVCYLVGEIFQKMGVG